MTNAKVDEEDLIDLMEDIMDQEFTTICDDNSIKEISSLLIKYLNMLKNTQMEQIRLELSQLPPCQMWIVQGYKVNFVSKPDDDSSTDEDDDDEMEGATITDNTTAPSTSGSTMQVEEEDVDPEWTVVKGSKGKKRN